MALGSNININITATHQQALAALHELEHLIHALVAPVSSLRDAFAGVAEVSGIEILADKIKDLAGEMAELGENATNMGLALGISAEQFQTLNESMQLVGGSADSLVRVQRMLSRAVEEATSNPLSHQADAFRALSIDAKEFGETLINDPVRAYKALADAEKSTGQQGVAGPLGFLLGRGASPELYRYFSEGARGIDELIRKTHELGAPTGEALHQLDELAESINALKVAFTNLGAEIISSLSGPLTWFTNSLKENYSNVQDWIRILRGSDIAPGPGAAGRGIFGDAHDIPGATPQEKVQLEDIRRRESSGDYSAQNPKSSASGGYGMIDETWRRWAAASGSGIRTDRYPHAKDAPMAMQDVAALYGLRTEGLTPWKASESKSALNLPDVNVEGQGGEGEAEKVHKKRMDDSTAEKKALDEQLKSINEVTKAREAQLSLEIQAAKGTGDEATVRILEKQKTDTQQEAYEQRAALIAKSSEEVRKTEQNSVVEGINLQRQAMAQEQSYHAEQVKQANEVLQAKLKALNAEEAEQLKQVDRLRSRDQLSIGEAEQMERQIVAAHQKAADEIFAEEQKNATGLTNIWQRVAVQRIELENETAQKIKDINDKAEDDRLRKGQQINQSIARDFASSFMSVITGKSTLLQAFENLGEHLGQSLVEKLGEKLLTNINFGSLFTGGGLLSGIGKFLGFEGGGLVPSAAGGWAVPNTVMARLHGGEMVLPKHLSEGIQGMIAGGGGAGGDIHIHAIDTQSGAQFLMQHGSAISQSWRNGGQSGNWSPRMLSQGGRYP